jgi:hypothetical protein
MARHVVRLDRLLCAERGILHIFVKLPAFLSIFLFPVLFSAIGQAHATLFTVLFPWPVYWLRSSSFLRFMGSSSTRHRAKWRRRQCHPAHRKPNQGPAPATELKADRAVLSCKQIAQHLLENAEHLIDLVTRHRQRRHEAQ